MFEGRKLVIATAHGKEKVIAPALETALGVRCFVPENFNSDQFGTFSGEQARTDDPVTTARNKCRAAMELSGCDLGIASEGSFGPHPHLFFVPADEEFLLLIDRREGVEILVRELSTDTNFGSSTVHNLNELESFAGKAGFPAHGLILGSADGKKSTLVKGIHDLAQLREAFERLVQAYGAVHVETDMRAMHNPSRMEVIAAATSRLIERVGQRCTACDCPGFAVGDVIRGLPCGQCGMPTRLVKQEIWQCQRCKHQETKPAAGEAATAEPMYCDFCNP